MNPIYKSLFSSEYFEMMVTEKRLPIDGGERYGELLYPGGEDESNSCKACE